MEINVKFSEKLSKLNASSSIHDASRHSKHSRSKNPNKIKKTHENSEKSASEMEINEKENENRRNSLTGEEMDAGEGDGDVEGDVDADADGEEGLLTNYFEESDDFTCRRCLSWKKSKNTKIQKPDWRNLFTPLSFLK